MGAPTNIVRLQPVGIEFEVEENETVLDAAFRQGIALPHGCKEGQCSACKCVLTGGDVELKKYSTFALNEMERGQDYILLCRTLAYSDLEVELLNYDEEVLSKSIPVRDFTGAVTNVSALTHDIRRLEITLEQPLKFWAGQYVDITLPGPETITRSFSMANSPGESQKLAFIIKKYPNGRFSSRLDGDLAVGTEVGIKGPYGTCFRRENKTGAMILVGGGSGMSPLWSILHDHINSGKSVRSTSSTEPGRKTISSIWIISRSLPPSIRSSPSSRFSPMRPTTRPGAEQRASCMRPSESTFAARTMVKTSMSMPADHRQ